MVSPEEYRKTPVSEMQNVRRHSEVTLRDKDKKPYHKHVDQMTLYYNIDAFQRNHFTPLAPHTSVWSTHEPFTVSDIVNLAKPMYSTIYNFILAGRGVL